MKNLIIILIALTGLGCGVGLSPEERLEKEALGHYLGITSCDSLRGDSVFISRVAISLDSATAIPHTIMEAITLLDSVSNVYAKHMFATCFPTDFHFSFGMWMRNNWELWKGGELAEEIESTFGIEHPDSMSGILLALNYACLQKDDKLIKELFENYYTSVEDEPTLARMKYLEKEVLNW